jgi:hypothetical protein
MAWTIQEAGPNFRNMGRGLNSIIREEYTVQLKKAAQFIKDKFFRTTGITSPDYIISRSGLLKSTVKATKVTLNRLTNKISGSVQMGSARTPYARIIELGGRTRPHVIRPKNASALVFYWPVTDKVMYLQKVNHPGSVIKGRHVLSRGMKAYQRNLILATGRALGKAIKQWTN